MNDSEIFQLAEAAGLAREWTSADGRPQQVTADTLRTILARLDLPCANSAQCRDSLARMADLKCEDSLPPLIIAPLGQAVNLPSLHKMAGKTYRIEFDTGGHAEGTFSGDRAELPPIEQPGYHRLFVGESHAMLAVAPPRCFGLADAVGMSGAHADPRLWGLGVQLYGLRRPGDGGIGDFTALARLAQEAGARGAAALAISPVHAMFSADVYRFSPYGPSSRLFLNALHIDPARVRGEDALARAMATLGGDVAAELARLEQEPLIDWPAAAALRLRLLRALYQQFSAAGDDRREFESFLAEGGEALRDHARFEALHGFRLGRGESGDWRTWPTSLRDPRGREVEEFARQHEDEVRFHAFLQWQAARGLAAAQKSAREAGMPVGLVADLAVGADNDGSQAWSRQKELINGLTVGAPPDQLNPRGQSWGLSAFSPHAMKARGFGAYIEMLHALFAYAGGVRIDHVLGLNRLWLVPEGASSEQGAYLHYPLRDLLRLIALESWRHRAIVIGEDLGTVPAGYQDRLADAGLLGIRVLLFEREGERFRQPGEWSPHAIATTATHDMPPLAAWWRGRDIDWRNQLDLLETGESEADTHRRRDQERGAMWRALSDAGCAHGVAPPGDTAPVVDAAACFIAATPAPLAMLPIEDALGLTEQPNLPGTVDSHPNWRRRLPETVDNLLNGNEVSHRLALLNRSRPIKRGS